MSILVSFSLTAVLYVLEICISVFNEIIAKFRWRYISVWRIGQVTIQTVFFVKHIPVVFSPFTMVLPETIDSLLHLKRRLDVGKCILRY